MRLWRYKSSPIAKCRYASLDLHRGLVIRSLAHFSVLLIVQHLFCFYIHGSLRYSMHCTATATLLWLVAQTPRLASLCVSLDAMPFHFSLSQSILG